MLLLLMFDYFWIKSKAIRIFERIYMMKTEKDY